MIALVAIVVLLATAPAAGGKGIAKVEVCGDGDCNVLVPGNGLTQRDLLALTEVVAPASPPRAAAGWFRVRVTMQHRGVDDSSWTHAWVPSARLLRAPDATGNGSAWFTVPRDTELSYRKVTHRLAPLPAATLRGLAAAKTAPEPPAGGSGLPWGWIALAGLVAGLAVTRLRGRRRRGPETVSVT